MSKIYHSFRVIHTLRDKFPPRADNLKIYRYLLDSQAAVIKKRRIDLNTLYESRGPRLKGKSLAQNNPLAHPFPM